MNNLVPDAWVSKRLQLNRKLLDSLEQRIDALFDELLGCDMTPTDLSDSFISPEVDPLLPKLDAYMQSWDTIKTSSGLLSKYFDNKYGLDTIVSKSLPQEIKNDKFDL